MDDGSCTLSYLKDEVRRFISERAWERYHTPKNIAESIVIEACELLELFQWLNDDEALEYSYRNVDRVGEELADVIIYCLSLANVLNIDLSSAILRKLEMNRRKYPADKFYGVYYKKR